MKNLFQWQIFIDIIIVIVTVITVGTSISRGGQGSVCAAFSTTTRRTTSAATSAATATATRHGYHSHLGNRLRVHGTSTNGNGNDNGNGGNIHSNETHGHNHNRHHGDGDGDGNGNVDGGVASRRSVLQSSIAAMSTATALSTMTAVTLTLTPTIATAADDVRMDKTRSTIINPNSTNPNFKLDCLLDLPPVPSDCVRLYLCRHGQTEYNRLKQIQGARVDAPLNGTGMRQAARLGAALSFLDSGSGNDKVSGSGSGNIVVLRAGAHSNMLRARQTASIAAATMDSILGSISSSVGIGVEQNGATSTVASVSSGGGDVGGVGDLRRGNGPFAVGNGGAAGAGAGAGDNRNYSFDMNVLGDDKFLQFVSDTATSTTFIDSNNGDSNNGDNGSSSISSGSSSSSSGKYDNVLKLQPLSSLGEVDFGPLNEGKPSTLARADMYATYGAWATGNIDASLGDGGETGRQVLHRANDALNSLVDIAMSNGGSAVAFSHSTYLRMMLGLVMDIPLMEAAAIEQKNCCINVLDVSTSTSTSTVVGGRRIVGPDSNLFGRVNRSGPRDFRLDVPNVSVVRVNEVQHLGGLV